MVFWFVCNTNHSETVFCQHWSCVCAEVVLSGPAGQEAGFGSVYSGRPPPAPAPPRPHWHGHGWNICTSSGKPSDRAALWRLPASSPYVADRRLWALALTPLMQPSSHSVHVSVRKLWSGYWRIDINIFLFNLNTSLNLLLKPSLQTSSSHLLLQSTTTLSSSPCSLHILAT